jgi:hypothetical protein
MSETEAKEISQDQYKEDFGIPSETQGNDKETKQTHALQYALDIRKFEIDLYWKRAAYFWTFIAAALAGYAVIQRTGNTDAILSLLVACLGFVFSFAWYCVNRGSKYWQENWENHVDFLENEVIGSLYKIVIERPDSKGLEELKNFLVGPSNFSVSKTIVRTVYQAATG